MKATKLLPILAVVLCVPGIALRALHLLNGFDVSTGLPTAGDKWIWFVIALFAISAIVYAVLALPLKTRNKVPFEQLIGTKETLFRMAAVVAGLIVAAGSLGYLYLTITTAEQDVAAWARVLEIVYAVMGVLTGGCMIGLAKAQGVPMTEKSAAMTLVPLFWSCLHLLVNYRMTCTDPKLASFGFGLVADVMLVLAFYELARLLFGKPAPAMLAFFAAVAVTMSVSDIGGYGVRYAGCLAVLPVPLGRSADGSRGLTGEDTEMLFVCYPKCSTCQKAKAWLQERGVAFDERDIKQNNPTEQELRAWHEKSGLPLKRFFNTSGLQYKALGLKDKLPAMTEDEQYALLATDGMLVKRPLIIGEDFALPGFKVKEWEERL